MRVWKVLEPEQRPVLNRSLPFPQLAATLLANRAIIEPSAVEEYLNPDYAKHLHDPYLFQDMRRVVDRIFIAMAAKQPVVVYGDYDADGVCSSALMALTLQELGANVLEVYLPHRETEGYGLNRAAVERFIGLGVNLLITLDCGTTNRDEVQLATEGGIDVIVIDHHHVPDGTLGAFALLNPKHPQETYPWPTLSSVGLAFKTAQALFQERIVRHPEEASRWSTFEKWLLDSVAIATVTDLVPLQGENRTLLKYGLVVLNKTKRVGLRALVEIMGGTLGKLDAYSIGFQIGPRLNAAGRMNDASAALELMMCTDEDRARTLAQALEDENRNRQAMTERMATEARQQAEQYLSDRVLVVVGDNWSVGLVGLGASRLLEQFHRPVLVGSRTARGIVGSGRSISAFNIIESLHTMPDLFVKFGGHAQACGFTLKNEAAISELRARLNILAHQKLKDDDLLPVLTIDESLMLKDVQGELLELIRLFEPFGMGNPKPKFLFNAVKAVSASRVGIKGQHLRLTLSDGEGTVRQAIGFNHGQRGDAIELGSLLDVVAEVVANEWHGRVEAQLKVLDFRPAVL